jgi:hypothetical protein
MTYASQNERQELIAGFRAIADFLESNPDIPAPLYADVLVFPPDVPGTSRRDEIDVIASRIGSGTETSESGSHYTTSRKFGPVEYRAVFIPDESRKRW